MYKVSIATHMYYTKKEPRKQKSNKIAPSTIEPFETDASQLPAGTNSSINSFSDQGFLGPPKRALTETQTLQNALRTCKSQYKPVTISLWQLIVPFLGQTSKNHVSNAHRQFTKDTEIKRIVRKIGQFDQVVKQVICPDKCQRELLKYGSKAAFLSSNQEVKCRQGHPMSRITVSGCLFECDNSLKCGNKTLKSGQILRCKKCDYDLCEACVRNKTKQNPPRCFEGSSSSTSSSEDEIQRLGESRSAKNPDKPFSRHSNNGSAHGKLDLRSNNPIGKPDPAFDDQFQQLCRFQLIKNLKIDSLKRKQILNQYPWKAAKQQKVNFERAGSSAPPPLDKIYEIAVKASPRQREMSRNNVVDPAPGFLSNLVPTQEHARNASKVTQTYNKTISILNESGEFN